VIRSFRRAAFEIKLRALFDHQEHRIQEKYGLPLSQVVLGYLTGQAFPVFPLVGPKTTADLQDCIRAAETRLSSADIFYLEHGEVPGEDA
jgi:aryl-alcohol dehydrogenase-like predicted oxidoreductase